jgi:hypothetical protein
LAFHAAFHAAAFDVVLGEVMLLVVLFKVVAVVALFNVVLVVAGAPVRLTQRTSSPATARPAA